MSVTSHVHKSIMAVYRFFYELINRDDLARFSIVMFTYICICLCKLPVTVPGKKIIIWDHCQLREEYATGLKSRLNALLLIKKSGLRLYKEHE